MPNPVSSVLWNRFHGWQLHGRWSACRRGKKSNPHLTLDCFFTPALRGGWVGANFLHRFYCSLASPSLPPHQLLTAGLDSHWITSFTTALKPAPILSDLPLYSIPCSKSMFVCACFALMSPLLGRSTSIMSIQSNCRMGAFIECVDFLFFLVASFVLILSGAIWLANTGRQTRVILFIAGLVNQKLNNFVT